MDRLSVKRRRSTVLAIVLTLGRRVRGDGIPVGGGTDTSVSRGNASVGSHRVASPERVIGEIQLPCHNNPCWSGEKFRERISRRLGLHRGKCQDVVQNAAPTAAPRSGSPRRLLASLSGKPS